MGRSVPVWLLLLCLILWMVVTVSFGWTVKSRMGGRETTGVVGDVALRIASFPSLVKNVANEIARRSSGDVRDEERRVAREPGADYSGFTPVREMIGDAPEGLLMRASPGSVTPGWRVLVGTFWIAGEARNAALLLAPDLAVVRQWILDETDVEGYDVPPPRQKFPHGFDILPDGSILYAFDGGVSVQRKNSCGAHVWSASGRFNHTIAMNMTEGTFWATRDDNALVEMALEDGAIVRTITFDDVIGANPDIDILEIRRRHENEKNRNSRNTAGRWMFDSFHPNDVEPLPEGLAAAFPDFRAGDLLISLRSLNLLFVLDPESLKVRWWRVGATQRQHDPDWMPDGRILAFNNRMSRDYSEIVAIDPKTFERVTVFDGRKNAFYSRIRGKVQLLDSGALVVTSPQQGRAFEVDPTGQVVLEVVNTKPGDDDFNYVLSEMKWLPVDFFSDPPPDCFTATSRVSERLSAR